MKPIYTNFLTVARAIIEENYNDETFGCVKFCVALRMSRSHIHRKLSEELGLSISDYIKQIRLEKAKDLLVQTNYPIYEIASKVGYSDANYFSRSFSKIYGVSPSQCRQASA
ncbi:MAG: helix-turn-helix transcriptional regulator [Arcicella sp.]|nr:helix-turn-helix transcriptional regulator [Arcicella sp.]